MNHSSDPFNTKKPAMEFYGWKHWMKHQWMPDFNSCVRKTSLGSRVYNNISVLISFVDLSNHMVFKVYLQCLNVTTTYMAIRSEDFPIE